MNETAIRVEQLRKKYRIGARREKYKTLRDSITEAVAAPFRRFASMHQAANGDGTIWALKNVSFEVKRGEVVGVIGRNGAGKSTLLKILSRTTEPTAGYAEIRGRVGSLLEVGTGFHPELSGRDNIYLNGAILGMRKKEIEARFDEIVAFAEVERFIDTPVKHYSSGMYLRLAFAVAAHLESEILLVDEVLAVGDAAFQKKCLGKMGEVVKQERTVIFVSHHMGSISQLCKRALWLEDGEVKLSGFTPDVIAAYLLSGMVTQATWTNLNPPSPSSEVRVQLVQVLSADNQPTAVVEFHRQFQVGITYDVIDPVRNLCILCRVTDSQGNIVWTSWDTDTSGWDSRIREPGRYLSVCKVPGGLLKPGRYLLSVGSHINNVKSFGYHDNVLAFDVSDVGYTLNPGRIGVITPLLQWEVRRDGSE